MTFFEGKYSRRKQRGNKVERKIKIELDEEVLDRIFNKDLNPNDKLWKKLGYGQDKLSTILANNDSPSGITAQELSEAIKNMDVIEE